ncbi:uncharacterized protein LOC114447647 [Parambassis ranga]|uniref:Uncharacterized protein LOC114447647 n=1 Tax=Parambassis ranga TaxID=210632 RepID=A0A6P7JSK9_9TELE|nr:uncharacterized protein LOC114447647 [Parambassis ranga]
MTFSYLIPLFLTGLVGLYCQITTVTEMSVKKGESISIPCFYPPLYKDNVKYLCRGKLWFLCKKEITTDQTNVRSGRFSISDDPSQSVFTVAIDDLTDKDQHFWCAVKMKYEYDVKQPFKLSVTNGVPTLYVGHQEIAGFEGGSVTAICHYNYAAELKWCKPGSSCVMDGGGWIDGTPVRINTSVPNVFNVTMSELRTENGGWYWCANEHLQMPVHVTVYHPTSATTWTLSTAHQPSSLLTSPEPLTAEPTNSTINETGGKDLQDEHKSSAKVMILIAVLVSQLFIIPAAFFGWRMVKRNKAEPVVCDTTPVPPTPDPDVFYATIVHNKEDSAQIKQENIPTESVIYSSLVIKDGIRSKRSSCGGSISAAPPSWITKQKSCDIVLICISNYMFSLPVMYSLCKENTFSILMFMVNYMPLRGRMNTFPVRIAYSRQSGSGESELLCSSFVTSFYTMAVHVSILLFLAALTGSHSVTTVTKVSVKAGDSISIPCLYEQKYIDHVKYLCEGSTWGGCTYAIKTNNRIRSEKFFISDDKSRTTFTVTIKQLRTTDTHFWCIVEIYGIDDGVPFYLDVTTGRRSLYVDHQEMSGFKGENITINCNNTLEGGESKWCRLGVSCATKSPASISGTRVTISESHNAFTVTMSKLKLEDSGWYYCHKSDFQMPVHITVTERPATTTARNNIEDSTITSIRDGSGSGPVDLKIFIIPLSLLLLVVTVAFLVWVMLRRKQTKAESSDTAKVEEEVVYSNVGFIKSPQGSHAEREMDVTYSSVVSIRQQTVKREEAKDAEVTYSTLAQQNM